MLRQLCRRGYAPTTLGATRLLSRRLPQEVLELAIKPLRAAPDNAPARSPAGPACHLMRGLQRQPGHPQRVEESSAGQVSRRPTRTKLKNRCRAWDNSHLFMTAYNPIQMIRLLRAAGARGGDPKGASTPAGFVTSGEAGRDGEKSSTNAAFVSSLLGLGR